MNRIFLFMLTGILLFSIGCTTEETNQKLISKIDSLNTRITQLEQEQNKSEKEENAVALVSDSLVIDQVENQLSPVIPMKQTISEKTKNPEKKIEPQTPKDLTNSLNDTVYHYYKNPKRISVKITPWSNEKRKIILFEPNGKESYSIEDVRHSYTSISEIKSFHTNGAVDRIETHLNPGASMYWYESSTTFEINNQPLWQTNQRFPASLEDYSNNASYWEKNCKCWKKQEVSIDQPPMRE